MSNEKDIGICLFEKMMGKRNIGSSRIRGHWYAKYWDRAEVLKMSKKYKIVIFQKSYWTEYAKAFKGIKIFDICDADFLWWHYKTKEMIEECDAVTTSTPALAEAFKKFTNKPVVCIPDRIDFDSHKEKKIHKGKAEWAVWFGYSNNFEMLNGVEKHLHDLGLGLIVISDKNYVTSSNYPVKILNIKWNIETINEVSYAIKILAKKYKIPLDRKHILGHREVDYTACPGKFTMKKIYDKLEI